MKIYKNRDWLYQKHWVDNLTLCEMALLADCCSHTVLNWMKKLDVERRPRSESNKLRRYKKPKAYQDRDWLFQKYCVEELSMQQMADILGCSRTTISGCIKETDIKLRTQSEAQVLLRNSKHKFYSNKDWLYKQYWKNELTLEQMAELASCSIGTIKCWMNRYSIKKRTLVEACGVSVYRRQERQCMDEDWLEKEYRSW